MIASNSGLEEDLQGNSLTRAGTGVSDPSAVTWKELDQRSDLLFDLRVPTAKASLRRLESLKELDSQIKQSKQKGDFKIVNGELGRFDWQGINSCSKIR